MLFANVNCFRRSVGIGLIAACLLLAAGLSAGSAGANNWAGASGVGGVSGGGAVCGSVANNSNNMADNWSHDLYYHVLTIHMQTATNWTIGNNFDETDMFAFEVSGYNSNTDVLLFDSTALNVCGITSWHHLGGGTVGLAICSIVLSNQRCGQHRIYYDNSWTVSASETNRRWLTCHEQGHGVGLNHRFDSSGSCLRTGSSAINLTNWDSHDRGHVNANY